MSEHVGMAEATAAERAAIEAVLGPPPDGTARSRRREAAGAVRRSMLLPLLRALQERTGGIGPGAVREIAARLDLPQADIYGVASFYALLDVTGRSPCQVHVCDDIACRARGAEAVWASLQGALAGRVGPGGAVQLERSPCLGQCDRAPAALALVAGSAPRAVTLGPVTATGVVAALDGASPPSRPAVALAAPDARASVLGRVGRVDPESLDAYRAAGGYEGLRAALALGRDALVRLVTEAGLQGRGGAAFPTGAKWRAVASQPERPHYVVANGDESEPGTFKDRVVMEEDPFALVEALSVAAYAVGAEQGYIYVRGEYPLAARRLRGAVDQARARGLLGPDILGRGVAFDVEVRQGAGAYICGEETALLNSIEGRAGEPRNKPPFPSTHGLFGRPTAVNNVETLLHALAIVTGGAAAFRAAGTEDAPGTRLFALSGAVARPGVYEASGGERLGELLERAGGMVDGRPLKAVLLGGAAGGFVGPGALDLRLTPAAVRAAGATLGSGAVVFFDDRVDLGAIVARIARFFRDESCGQCVPCRIGSVRQEEMVARLLAGRPAGSVAEERARFADLAAAMRDASICGLGQTAPAAIESALRLGILGGEAE